MFSYNYYKNLKRPEVYLSYPDKRIIGTLVTHNLQTDIIANACDQGSFTVYSHENGEKTPFYDDIIIGKYILVLGVNWFRINQIDVQNKDADNEYKEISIESLESELGQTYLTSFGSMGTDDDNQGGLDRYCLYSLTDQEHSILHIFLQSNPGWSIYYVDPEISTEYRNFQEDSIDSYSFLMDTVADVYECIFTFDGFDKTVSAYKLENLGKNTNITLQYRNLIKSIKKSSSEDDVKTVLTVCGGNDDRTNTTLGIIDVNISGSNQIYDFSYYYPMMSTELKNALIAYKKKCSDNEAAYQSKLAALKTKYEELGTLKNHVPDDHDTTDWSQYGLAELNEKEAIYKTNMKLYMNDTDQTLYSKNQKLHAAVEKEIEVRKSQISAKETEIDNHIKSIQSLIVNLHDFIGDKLYQELGPYIREDALTDDSFIVTNIMTDAEILEMQKALLSHAYEELAKVSSPQYTLDIDLVNFTVNYDYKMFTDQLEMFNVIHISMDDENDVMDVRLLKLHINWDDSTDFSATFSNKTSMEESWSEYAQIKKQADSTASTVDFSTGAWNKAASTSVTMDKYMNSVLDATKQQIVSNENNEILIDQTGIMAKKWVPEKQGYDPAQLWITNNCLAITTDNWETVGLALGYVKVGNDYFFGLVAEKIFGTLYMGKGLYLQNTSGTYTINDSGLTAQNGSYKVGINPNTPGDIFTISIDNKKLLYVDATNKKLKFEGDIESKSGHIASYVISENDLTSGKVGMSSTTTSGAISFWAGSTDRNNAAFRVDNNGKLVCSIADVSGNINAKSGTIGNWKIQNSQIIGDSTSIISGGTLKGTLIDGGTVQGGVIQGSIVKAGKNLDRDLGFGSNKWMLYANDSEVRLGNFRVKEYNGRYIIADADDWVGMSPVTGVEKTVSLWAGWHSDRKEENDEYDFKVSQSGYTQIKELYVVGKLDNWHYNTETKDVAEFYDIRLHTSYMKKSDGTYSRVSEELSRLNEKIKALESASGGPSSKPSSWTIGWNTSGEFSGDWIKVVPSSWSSSGHDSSTAKYIWWYVNVHFQDGNDTWDEGPYT